MRSPAWPFANHCPGIIFAAAKDGRRRPRTIVLLQRWQRLDRGGRPGGAQAEPGAVPVGAAGPGGRAVAGTDNRPHRAVLARPGQVAALLGSLALAGCDQGADSGAAAPAAPPPPKVTVAAPLVKEITEWYEFTGRFEAIDSVEVRARVSGYVQSVHFDDGGLVEQGQLLFVIDPRPYEAAVEQARAQLASAQASVDLATAELARAGELVERATVSRSTYDQRTQELRVAEASVEMAEAALRRAELDLAFTRVAAPIAGRISDRRVDLGNLVTGDPSATLLTTIVALDPLHFLFDMSEADFLGYQRAVERGLLPAARDQATPVQLRLPDEPDGETWPRPGTLNFLDNQMDVGAGTIRARAVVPNADHFITPGQFGRLRLPGSPQYEAILVPDSAILADQASKVVMTVGADGLVAPRVIRAGPSYAGGLRIVREGLGAEDRIVINGLMRVRPGVPVEAEPGEIAPPPAAAEPAATSG
jgi:RND family efflux transporter MFP subunit